MNLACCVLCLFDFGRAKLVQGPWAQALLSVCRCRKIPLVPMKVFLTDNPTCLFPSKLAPTLHCSHCCMVQPTLTLIFVQQAGSSYLFPRGLSFGHLRIMNTELMLYLNRISNLIVSLKFLHIFSTHEENVSFSISSDLLGNQDTYL